MKIQHLILLLSILVFASCRGKIKDDIRGNWSIIRTGSDESIITELNFKTNKVEIIGENLFKETGEYQVKNGKIEIKLNRDDLEIELDIQKTAADTFLIYDSLKYKKTKLFYANYEVYELIGIPTNKYLSSTKEFFHVIHFYKSKSKEVRIRCGDKNASFEDIPLFLDRRHSKPRVLIFLGKGINLQDLSSIYCQLAFINQLKVWFVTKKEGISKTHIFADNIEIWREDLENQNANATIFHPLPPPPPIELTSKKNYLKDGGREIKILNKRAFSKLDKIEPNRKYVISINQKLPIKDYFELKRKIRAKRKMNKQIITEIK